jgi:DNA-binding PadR family transcriptional regulator
MLLSRFVIATGLNITYDITFEVNSDTQMFAHKKWLRHTAMVPKGFIRYRVLEALNEKPMSGSEIISEIKKQTGGFWKPSPGSIYPLLAWMQDNGFIKELPMENGMKRYELTETGKVLLAEQKNIRKHLREEVGFLPAPFFDNLLMLISPEKKVEIRDSIRNLAIAFFELSSSLQERFSENAIDEARQVLDEATRKFNEIKSRLKGEKSE